MEGGGAFRIIGNGHLADTKQLHGFQKSFVQVQAILDQNRLLINEINQNQESKIPDNLGLNVSLIRELNNNIRRIFDLFGDLALSFNRSIEMSSEGNNNGKPGHKRVRPLNDA